MLSLTNLSVCAIIAHDDGYGPGTHFSEPFTQRLTFLGSGLPHSDGISTARGLGGRATDPTSMWDPRLAWTSWFWLPACPSCSEYPKAGERLIRAAQRLPRSMHDLESKHRPFPTWVLGLVILKNPS